MSDKLFQSRRGPPVAIFCGVMLLLGGVMSLTIFAHPFVVGASALVIVAAVTGVHSLMSGTAAADFGGRKASATCSGLVDGCVYLGSGLQSLGVGFLVTKAGWQWWSVFLMPFALIGGLIAWHIWDKLPAATRKFIDEKERKGDRSQLGKAQVADVG
jgi:OPA family glycerol-3-phosphate transporter-like MFS transporter